MRRDLAEIWKLLWVRIVVYLLLAYLLLQLLGALFGGARGALLALFLAFIFAYLTSPIVGALEKRRVPRFLGVLLVYLGLGFFLGLASFLIADMVNVLARFATELPRVLTPLLNWIENIPARVGQVEIPPALEGAFAQAVQSLQILLEGFTQTLLQALRALLAQGATCWAF